MGEGAWRWIGVTPYYQDAAVTLYHGDCREILPQLRCPNTTYCLEACDGRCDIEQALVLTDPPYGIDAAVDNSRFSGGNSMTNRSSVGERIPVHGDSEPFDPTFLLSFSRLVLFGAQNYAAKLPPSNGWLVWDKRAGIEDMQGWPFGEGELAWTNLTGAVRFWRNRWMGLVRSAEFGDHLHPTQKPLGLMTWIIEKWSKPDDLVLDPFAGSGTTLRAAKDLGRRAIGIEIEERYCEIAAKRLRQEVLPL